jgi:hypothetical protein
VFTRRLLWRYCCVRTVAFNRTSALQRVYRVERFRRRTGNGGGGLEELRRILNRIYGDFGKLNAILDKMENDGYDNLSRKIKELVETRVVKLIVLLKCTYNTNRDLSRKTIVICRL